MRSKTIGLLLHADMAPVTRATTSRATKVRAQESLKSLVNQRDPEVSFHGQQLDHNDSYVTIDRYEASPALQIRAPANPNEDRVDMLHAEVDRVRTEVAGINDKLDILVNRLVMHSTPPRTRTTQDLDDTIPYQALPPPRELRSAANRDGYVDQMLKHDCYAPPHNEGKNTKNDIRDCNNMPKPYMYIVRESCQTDKQKLEVRTTLPPLEYINAMVALIRDSRAYNKADFAHIMQHLQDVTQDAAEGAWPTVRRWSQRVWDLIEEGKLEWADYQSIYNLRLRMAINAGQTRNSTADNTQVGSATTEVICRQHNTRQGCRHRGHHTDANVKYLHNCAFCDAIHRTCAHSVFDCGRKLQYPPRGEQADRFQQNQQQYSAPQSWRQAPPAPMQQYQQQPPKNVYQAPCSQMY